MKGRLKFNNKWHRRKIKKKNRRTKKYVEDMKDEERIHK